MRQGRNDLIEDGINQPSRHPLRQMWVLSRNTEYQLGFDHDEAPQKDPMDVPSCARWVLSASILAPKNSLLDFGGDFAEPLFGFFRFVTIELNLSF